MGARIWKVRLASGEKLQDALNGLDELGFNIGLILPDWRSQATACDRDDDWFTVIAWKPVEGVE